MALQCFAATASEFDAYLILEAAQEQSKVIYGSGLVADVITSVDGKKPDYCPDGTFWLSPEKDVFDCRSGAQYSLKPVSAMTTFGTARFKLIGVPNDKTDEPGPSLK